MRTTIHFLLGHTERTIADVRPTTTVLEWLRAERLVGTKEGCAEGDCGACTVVLHDGVTANAVNACILFLPALDGRQLLTVEHLRGPDGTLHAVQHAMIEHHAAQCGFCTPGFVMSLYALHQAGPTDRAAVHDALAGNLCRCTGYRPIVDAALASCAAPAPPSTEIVARLHALPDTPLAIEVDGGRFLVPRSLDQLAALRVMFPDATLLAGGTDVGLWATKEHRDLPHIISVERVPELGLIEDDGAIRIGAGVTYEAALPVLARHWPELGGMLRRLGSRQVRNRGTIGGNIANASPIGDMMPALIALDAILVLRRGPEQRRLPIADYFLAYRRTALAEGEFIERIDLPPPRTGELLAVAKVTKRPDQDISAVCLGIRIVLDGNHVADARIGVGGMAAIPARARRTEQALVGQSWSRATVESAMRALDAEFSPITDMRASAGYRTMVARNLLLRCFLDTGGERTAVLAA